MEERNSSEERGRERRSSFCRREGVRERRKTSVVDQLDRMVFHKIV